MYSRFSFSLLCLASFVVACNGDVVDDAMIANLRTLNVRGAGITFFDASQMDQPISRGYGQIGRPANSASVTEDTAFMLASVSKVFVAAAVSVLVDLNIIGLDDDICDTIPADWQRSACRNPNFPNDKVTWRMLVTHRSSLREDIPTLSINGDEVEASYGPAGGYTDGTAINPTCPLDDIIRFYRDFLTNKPTETSVGATLGINWYDVGQRNGGAWQNFRPGSRVSYSNFAVGYLPVLVELASGESFPDFCRDNLFGPLGMTNTAWFRDDLPSTTAQAIPVEFLGGNNFGNIGHYCFIDYGSGQLYTSARDMALWAKAMLNFGAPTLWSASTGEQVFKCQEKNVQGNTPSNCEFAMGWSRLDNSMKSNAESYLNNFKKYDWTNGGLHEGAEAGCQTHLIVLPSAGVFASVLTNTDLNDEYAPQKMAATLATIQFPSVPTSNPNPSPAPFPKPSQSPVPAPTQKPVSVPTPKPVSAPTAKPVASPTPNPVPAPTPKPVPLPTARPVPDPTRNPVPAPTQSPVTDPPSCGDSNVPIWINSARGFRSCSWLAERNFWKDYLCGWDTDANYYCRDACDSCSYWDDNADYTPLGRPNGCFDLDIEFFVNNRIGWKDCSWLQGSSYWKSELCGYDTDADYACRRTCGSCYHWN